MWLGMPSFELPVVVCVLCILTAIWCIVHRLMFPDLQGNPDLPSIATTIVAWRGRMRC